MPLGHLPLQHLYPEHNHFHQPFNKLGHLHVTMVMMMMMMLVVIADVVVKWCWVKRPPGCSLKRKSEHLTGAFSGRGLKARMNDCMTPQPCQ